ncbi:zf-HC2 domain-containing protein [candidate division KSB1 bacterium]
MISCNNVLDYLSSYMEGDVSSPLKKEIEDHITYCHKCKVTYENAQLVKGYINRLSKLHTSSSFEMTLRERIARDQSRKRNIIEDLLPDITKKPIIGFAAAAVGVAIFMMVNSDNVPENEFNVDKQNIYKENILIPSKGTKQAGMPVDKIKNQLMPDKSVFSASPVSDSTREKFNVADKPHSLNGNIQYIKNSK